jgi:mRNA interferase MazF
MNPQPGEIWLADLGLAAKTRPVIISPAKTPTRRGLSLYTCLSPLNGGAAHTKYLCLGLPSLNVNQ